MPQAESPAKHLQLLIVYVEKSNGEQSAMGLNSIKFIDCLSLLHDNNPSLRYPHLPALFAPLALLEVRATTNHWPAEQIGANAEGVSK